MTDANLMEAECVHGVVWYDCVKCVQYQPCEGPQTFWICHTCDMGGHTCVACGADVSHGETQKPFGLAEKRGDLCQACCEEHVENPSFAQLHSHD